MIAKTHSHQPASDTLLDVIDEITARIQAGESVELAGYVARFPEHAE